MSLSPLPIDSLLPEIAARVREHSQVILTATPGAGKTTRLPPRLLESVTGKIAVLQPRRMAAVAAAQRVCEETGWRMGREVGYQVRFESKITPETRLIFMTDAVLLRRLTEDPELNDFDLVVIDEFHERNLNQDVILGVLTELQQVGRKIHVLIMSATLELTGLRSFWPSSVHIDVPGKVFPLEIRYGSKNLVPDTSPEFYDRVVGAIQQACRETPRDVLVFLPGVGEIQRTQELLESKALEREIVPLHGSLTLEAQTHVLRGADRPRVILATNVAEASVTVPGVDFVIDTGLAKVLRMHPTSGFSRLELQRIAQFNARQRAGRAAREKAGVCWRLWTPHEETTQAETLPAECQRSDLTGTLLLLSFLGLTDFSTFTWLEPPPPVLLRTARDYLHSIRALDEENRLTDRGRTLLSFPLIPRWGALLAEGASQGILSQAAEAAALLQERDFLRRDQEIHARTECDLLLRLHLLRERTSRGTEPVRETARQLARLGAPLARDHGARPLESNQAERLLRQILLQTQSDRLCRRRGSTDRGVMVGGRGVRLARESQVRTSEFFVALQGIDPPGQPDTTVSWASGFSKTEVLEAFREEIQWVEDISFEETKGRFFQRRVKMFRDLELEEPTLLPLASEDLGPRLVDVLVSRWDWVLSQNENLNSWMSRWRFLCGLRPEWAAHLPPEKIREWVELATFGKNKIESVVAQDWLEHLPSILPAEIRRQVEQEAPAHFTAPSGHSHRIHFEENLPPYVEVRLQEMFGTTATPLLGFGQVPLTFRLLAPNFRPVQTTSDIAGFWQRAYIEVRKELRARYPKHPWPEDPLTAPAVAKGRARK